MSKKQEPVSTFRVLESLPGTAVLILGIALASCRGTPDVILHPTAGNIQSVADPRFVLHENSSDTLPYLDASTLEGVLIGQKEGEPLEMIGTPQDFDISVDGLYYVDIVYGHVRAYDFLGNLTAVIGKRGQGPEEFPFVQQVSFTRTVDAPLLVVGASSKRISVFKQEGAAWVLRNYFHTAHSFGHGDLCAMHDHVYTIGYSEEQPGVIHKHTLEGELVLSFGEPYGDPDPFIRSNLSERGTLYCNETHHTIAYADDLNPVVSGFSDTGVIRWRVELADAKIAPTPQRRTDAGQTTIGFPAYGSGKTSSIRFIPATDSDLFFVSYLIYGSEGAEQQHLYSVDAVSGEGMYIGYHPFRINGTSVSVKALDAQRIYTTVYRGFPQLGIYPRSFAR